MSLGEFDIIARYFARRSGRGDVLLGVGDDAAVLDTHAGRKLVVAMDTVVEGVHFPVETDAADIGALATGASRRLLHRATLVGEGSSFPPSDTGAMPLKSIFLLGGALPLIQSPLLPFLLVMDSRKR